MHDVESDLNQCVYIYISIYMYAAITLTLVKMLLFVNLRIYEIGSS